MKAVARVSLNAVLAIILSWMTLGAPAPSFNDSLTVAEPLTTSQPANLPERLAIGAKETTFSRRQTTQFFSRVSGHSPAEGAAIAFVATLALPNDVKVLNFARRLVPRAMQRQQASNQARAPPLV